LRRWRSGATVADREEAATSLGAALTGTAHAYAPRVMSMRPRTERDLRFAGAAVGIGRLFVALALAAPLGGCTRVAAYERGRLAHPSMSSRQRMGAGQAHLYAIREGARGGSLGAGSGCGCN
jgi:hypothetical protein